MPSRNHKPQRAPRGLSPTTGAPRAGFTLIEILVVISIITIIMGIVFAVYADSLQNARVESTRVTIRQLDAHLQDRQEAFNRLNLDSQARQFILRYNNGGNAPPMNRLDPVTHLQLAELIVRKDRFRAAFPQRLEDLYGFDGAAGGGDDSPLLAKWSAVTGTTGRPGAHDRDTESIELLYLALTEGGTFGPPALGLDEINANHVKDTDLDGLMEIVDEWGRPLRFYNWPTRLIRPEGEYQDIDGNLLGVTGGVVFSNVTAPSGTIPLWLYGNPLNQDPDDPTGILSLWRDGEDIDGSGDLSSIPPPPPSGDEDLNANGQVDPADGSGTPIRFFFADFQLAPGPTTALKLDEENFHTLNTYHVPLIVSAGPDGRTGLYEPDGRDPRMPTVAPTTSDFPRRLAQPLATAPGDSEVDYLYDNVTNRRRR